MTAIQVAMLEELMEAFKKVCEYLEVRGAILVNAPTVEVKGFYDPKRYKKFIIGLINEFVELMEEYELYFDADEFTSRKEIFARQLSKIVINVGGDNKNRHMTPEMYLVYQNFKSVQLECKTLFSRKLKKEPNAKHKGKKFIWLGSNRELMELFSKLIECGYIKREPISKEQVSLPIIEGFDCLDSKTQRIIPINASSFNSDWKHIYKGTDKPEYFPDYTEVFEMKKRKPS